MSIFKNGIKVSGQVEVGGSTGTSSDVITGGDTPGFTTPAAYFKETFPHIPPLGQRSRAPKKLLMLGIGNSNWLGQATGSPAPDQDGVHRPEPGLFEVSQGREHSAFSVAPAGELMQLRVPNQDNFLFEKNEAADGPNWPAPTINPVSSFGKAGPKMAAMKRVKALLPEVEEIAILTCAIGGSGLTAINSESYRNVADWLDPGHSDASGNDGQALVDLVNKANTFLAANPDYECGWIAGQLGPIAGFAGMGDTEFREKLLATLAYIRTNVTGASQAVFTIHSMHPNMVSGDFTVASGATNQGVWGPLEDVILGFASDDPLLRTGVIDASPFTATLDGRHHTDEEFNEIGRLHGEAYVAVRMGLENAPTPEEIRLLPSKDGTEFKCATTGCNVFSPVTEWDSRFGYVLRANTSGYGFQTDVRLKPEAHTIFARVRWMGATPPADGPLFSGKKPVQSDQGRVVTLGEIAYGDGGTSLDPLLDDGQTNALTQYDWCSVALVFDGTQFEVYKNGVSIVSGGAPAASFTDSETILELMGYGQDASTTTADAQMTDIRVAARALTDAEVLAWHQDTPTISEIPISALRTPLGNAVGEAQLLGLNPTVANGNSWQNQMTPGNYLLYHNADGGSVANGLPWSPRDFGFLNPLNSTDFWFITIDIFIPGQAQVVCTTYAVVEDGGANAQGFITRSWRKSVRKVDGAWADLSGGYPDSTENGWEELTPYRNSPDGTVYRIGVANDGTFSSTLMGPPTP